MQRNLFALSAIVIFTTSAHAAPVIKAPKAAAALKTVALICPVTGDKIPSIKEAAGHSTYGGKTYYFCCAMCKPQFDKNPAQFVKPAGKSKTSTAVQHSM